MTIVNEVLFRIDTVVFDVPRRSGFKSIIGAVSKNIATPPANPVAGAVYIIPDNPAWPWTGKAGQIAYFDKIWRYIAPNRGLVLFVKDEQSHYIFTGDGWQRVKSG
jgi:hypothetical protein